MDAGRRAVGIGRQKGLVQQQIGQRLAQLVVVVLQGGLVFALIGADHATVDLQRRVADADELTVGISRRDTV